MTPSSWITPEAAKGVGSAIAGRGLVVAMRDIRPGEELTTDYALFDDYDGSMTCQCGTALCRGMITGHDWRQPDLQRKYRGYFSWYLQRRIQDQ